MNLEPELQQRHDEWRLTLLPPKSRATVAQVEAAAKQQQSLLSAVDGGPLELASYFEKALGLHEQDWMDAPLLPRTLTPSEYRDPCFETEREIVDAWSSSVSPLQAAQPLFWTLCHVRWLRAGRLGNQIDQALTGALANGNPESDQETSTRHFLRRIGALPHYVRGKLAVLADCTMSRAYWRGRLAVAASNSHRGVAPPAAVGHRVLHSSNAAWDGHIGDSVFRITVLNQPSIRAALIACFLHSDRATGPVPAKEFQQTGRLVARSAPAVVFDAMPWDELLSLTRSCVDLARASQEDSSEDN